MSRLAVLRRHPKRTIGGLTVVFAATAVAVGSGATFSSQSSNEGNVFTSGTLHHTNTATGALATANITDIKPGFGLEPDGTSVSTSGQSVGTVTLHNDGTLDGDVTVTATTAGTAYSGAKADEICGGGQDLPSPATCQPLDDALRLKLTYVDAGGNTVTAYDGVVSGLDDETDLGSATPATNKFSLAPDESRTYTAAFYLPTDTGNAFQGGSATVNLQFAEVQQ